MTMINFIKIDPVYRLSVLLFFLYALSIIALYVSYHSVDGLSIAVSILLVSGVISITILLKKITKISNLDYKKVKNQIKMKSDDCPVVHVNLERYVNRKVTEYGHKVSMLGIAIGILTFSIGFIDNINSDILQPTFIGLVFGGIVLTTGGLVLSFFGKTNNNPKIDRKANGTLTFEYDCL